MTWQKGGRSREGCRHESGARGHDAPWHRVSSAEAPQRSAVLLAPALEPAGVHALAASPELAVAGAALLALQRRVAHAPRAVGVERAARPAALEVRARHGHALVRFLAPEPAALAAQAGAAVGAEAAAGVPLAALRGAAAPVAAVEHVVALGAPRAAAARVAALAPAVHVVRALAGGGRGHAAAGGADNPVGVGAADAVVGVVAAAAAGGRGEGRRGEEGSMREQSAPSQQVSNSERPQPCRWRACMWAPQTGTHQCSSRSVHVLGRQAPVVSSTM